jgi:hypothetical protein
MNHLFKFLGAVMISTTPLLIAISSFAQPSVNSLPLKLNEIQVLGTHNSYAKPIDPEILKYAGPLIDKAIGKILGGMTPEQLARFREEHPAENLTFAEGMAYDHPPLKHQLNAGLRSLEIDVHADPVGGLYSDPAAYRFLRSKGLQNLASHDKTDLEKPGFKVLHIADLDVRSHCSTLAICLKQLREWSVDNPKHSPVFIMLEIKSNSIKLFPGSVDVAQFEANTYQALDQEIITGLGRDRIITPDDVRGSFSTLEAAVLAKNWPTYEASKGKFVFLMLTALNPESTRPYLENHPNLEGRVAFLRAGVGQPHSAFLLLDNAIVRSDEIKQRVKEGYLVRTRSDIETAEARTNDTRRAKAAFESGAQIISTDFFLPSNPFGTTYRVQLPGGKDVRCNPILKMGKCEINFK